MLTYIRTKDSRPHTLLFSVCIWLHEGLHAHTCECPSMHLTSIQTHYEQLPPLSGQHTLVTRLTFGLRKRLALGCGPRCGV